MDPRRLNYLRALDVDVWVPRDSRIERSAPIEQPAPDPSDSRPVSVRATSPAEPVTAGAADARAACADSMDWTTLEAAVRSCTLCDLHRTRTQAVFGVGNRAADWMIIGEAPGADEDRKGEPFVGRAGQLLTSMLRSMGLAREQVFIANILKCRPPGNRDPRPEETRCCTPYLFRQIELIDPRLILCVGRIAAQTLLQTDVPIGKLRGSVHRLPQMNRPMVVTYHPAYLLRSPLEKRKVWQDLTLAMSAFEDMGDPR